MSIDLQEMTDLLRSGQPFVICSFPGAAEMETFKWTNGEFAGTNGRRFIVQSWNTSQSPTPDFISSHDDHLALVQKAIDAMRAGRMEKVVLSRIREVHRINDGEKQITALFSRLVQLYPNAFCYVMRHPTAGLWMGATPETLLRCKGTHYQTMALAGTRPNQDGKSDQLYNWQEKELHEHEVVVRDIAARLKPFGHVSASAVRTIAAGPVAHLLTDIEFNSAAPVLEIAAALHPTPAVCGWPLRTSFDFIQNEEPHARGLYAGYLGVIEPSGDAHLFVNLRCMRIEDNRYLLFVGGGITAASTPEAEWEETENKARTLLRAIG